MNSLIIDDDIDKIEMLQELIAYYVADCLLETSFCGNDALNLLKTKTYHYIFLDHYLPDCKGSEIISNIKFLQPNACFISISNDNNILAHHKLFGYHHVLSPPYKEHFRDIINNNCL